VKDSVNGKSYHGVSVKRSDTIAQKSSTSAPTLVHVARLAGVGLGTASRALSGQGYVHDDTMKRILEAAERLGYRRNEVARSLRVKQSYVVGIVVPDIGGPFMIDFIRAAQSVLRANRYMSVLAFTDDNQENEEKEIEYLMQRQIDGLLVVPTSSSSAYLSSAQAASVHTVFFDQPLADKDFDAILVRNRQGAKAAVEHLIEHGHKRIACVGINRHLYSIRKRIEGYRDAIKDAGLPEYLAMTEPEDIYRQVSEWLQMKDPPTAIFSLNELSSIKVIEALGARHVRMPDQIAFIGFDEIQLGQYLDPPITTVVQPAAAMGEQAAKRLLERIASKEQLPGKHVLLDTTLLLGRSCGCHLPKV
jgi:LacI family transcriptional regulator